MNTKLSPIGIKLDAGLIERADYNRQLMSNHANLSSISVRTDQIDPILIRLAKIALGVFLVRGIYCPPYNMEKVFICIE